MTLGPGGRAGSVTTGRAGFVTTLKEEENDEGDHPVRRKGKSIGRDAQRAVMMETGPSAPLVVPEPNFLLELLVIALDAPAHFGDVDQTSE